MNIDDLRPGMGVDELARRFGGIDIQFRRDWPGPWRARLVTNKNERSEYRVAAYGASMGDAIDELMAMIAEIDGAVASRFAQHKEHADG